jgi:hypothetical protein
MSDYEEPSQRTKKQEFSTTDDSIHNFKTEKGYANYDPNYDYKYPYFGSQNEVLYNRDLAKINQPNVFERSLRNVDSPKIVKDSDGNLVVIPGKNPYPNYKGIGLLEGLLPDTTYVPPIKLGFGDKKVGLFPGYRIRVSNHSKKIEGKSKGGSKYKTRKLRNKYRKSTNKYRKSTNKYRKSKNRKHNTRRYKK